MAEENTVKPQRTGLYEKSVHAIMDRLKPYLHKVTQGFVAKSVDEYAKDNPRFARMIEFEVRRRGDGAGLTQDVAEPILWMGIKTLSALAIAAVGESFKNRTIKIAGLASSLTIMANQLVEAFRLIPRYKAGLQGSLEMAIDRWRSIETTGIDPFNQQQSSREITKTPDSGNDTKSFATHELRSRTIHAASLQEHASKTSSGEKSL